MIKHVDVKTGRKFFTSPELEDGSTDPQPRGVRRGEKSTSVVWAGKITVPKKDAAGNVVLKDGKPVMVQIYPLKFFPVFNLDQCSFPEGTKGAKLIEKLTAVSEVTPVERDEAAEALVADYLANGPSLAHGGNSAHYVPAQDHIQMPPIESFDSSAHYVSTLYHELTHSTGHDSRLKREGIAAGTFGGFGSKVYSEEELVAEIGAAMLTALAGIDQAAIFDNSAAYVQHWISKLESDNKLIYRAARDAQKAVDCILGTTFKDEDEAA
jgi:antirestriction protein ArdC